MESSAASCLEQETIIQWLCRQAGCPKTVGGAHAPEAAKVGGRNACRNSVILDA